jgi:hypothetical protein
MQMAEHNRQHVNGNDESGIVWDPVQAASYR